MPDPTPTKSKWIVLPIAGGLWVCKESEGLAEPAFPLALDTQDDAILDRREMPGIQDVAVSSTSDYAAVRSRGGRALQVYELTEDGGIPIQIALPRDLRQIRTVAFYGHRLFVGGAPQTNPSTRLGFFDLTHAKPRFTPLDVPDSLGVVDAPVVKIVIRGDRLYAIDTSFTPKLVLVFDIAKHEPQLVIGTRIPSGVDDNVIDLAIGRSYAAILSESRSKEGKAWKIGVFDSDTFDEVATFFHRAKWNETLSVPAQIEALDDLFLIAHGLQGLGVARLQDSEATRFSRLFPIQPWSHPYLPLHRISYVQPLGTGRVVAMHANEQSGGAYVVVKRGKFVWWEELTF